MVFIAGMFHQHRNAKFLQFFLYLRIVIDHGGFQSQVAFFRQDQLIIRCVVFSGKRNRSTLQRLFRFIDIPAVRLGSGKADASDPIQSPEKIHRGSRHQIDIFQWLMDHGNVFVQPFRCFFSLRHQKKLVAAFNRNQGIIALIIIHGKLIRILKLQTVVIFESCQILLRSASSGRLTGFFGCEAPDGNQRCRRRKDHRKPQNCVQKPSCSFFHFYSAFSIVEESNCRVYSIS